MWTHKGISAEPFHGIKYYQISIERLDNNHVFSIYFARILMLVYLLLDLKVAAVSCTCAQVILDSI